jgi:hypothetical protein
MKLKTLILILLVFYILSSISSPYKKTTKKTTTGTTTGTTTTGTTGGTTGGTTTAGTTTGTTAAGKWIIVAHGGEQVIYDASVTPLTFQHLSNPWAYATDIFRYAQIRNMLISLDSFVMKFDSITNTWSHPRLYPPTDFTAGTMGDTLIGFDGKITTYIPATDSWTPLVQGPPDISYLSLWWYVIVGNMVISYRGEKMSSLVNGVWSSIQPGPGAPTGGHGDAWHLSLGNVLISMYGSISRYTATGWSTPSQGLPLLTGRDNGWACVAGNLVISSKGQICKYNTNGTFTTVTTTPALNPDQFWVGALKIA